MCKKNKKFVHLHCHTYHSILDGAGSIDDYIKRAKEFGHPAIAITDHGTMSGTFEHYQKCKSAGIKPIIGVEAYLNDRMGKFANKQDEGKDNHQIILVKNKDGFVNLNKLVYRSMTEGFYYRPRITTDWLLENKNGLIVTSSCLASKFSQLILSGKENEAEEFFKLFLREFGDDFYAEIQLNEATSKEGVHIQKLYNDFVIRMSQKYDIMPILTGDVHYAFPEDNKLQDTLIAINQHEKIGDAFSLQTRNLYYSNGEDFHNFNKQFGFNYDEKFLDMCLENTIKVADKCNFEFETGVEKYPIYEPTKDVISYFNTNNNAEIIKKLAHAKLMQKLKKYQEIGMFNVDEEFVKKYQDRLEYEISVIESKKMLDYFLVNWEIIRDYRSKGFEVGPARGCFVPNSRVKMADGMYAPIDTIQIGDKVIDAFGDEREVIDTLSYDIEEDIIELEFEDGRIIECTLDHEILTENRGWVQAKDLTGDDSISSIDGVFAKLKNRKIKNYKGRVFDLTIENTHSYNIEGIGVHNSAAGSLLSWCLDITKIDPVRFELYFERFLNPERNCLTENCYVLMKDGSYKKITDIKVGDPAMTENGLGNLVQIHERQLEDEEDVFEIETEGGTIIQLTGNHIVPVIRSGERIEVRVDEILLTDELLTI